MIYQTPTIDDLLQESAFRLMRRAHALYYAGVVSCRDFLDPIHYETNTLLMETLGWEVKEAELHYADLKGYCEHHYAKNANGDYQCTRCYRYNPLYPYIKP